MNIIAQIEPLSVPIITVGASGYVGNGEALNTLYLLVGREDLPNYELTKRFYDQLQKKTAGCRIASL